MHAEGNFSQQGVGTGARIGINQPTCSEYEFFPKQLSQNPPIDIFTRDIFILIKPFILDICVHVNIVRIHFIQSDIDKRVRLSLYKMNRTLHQSTVHMKYVRMIEVVCRLENM